MKPKIHGAVIGPITIDGQRVNHDVPSGLSGEVAKRKKKLAVDLAPTPEAVARWNQARGAAVGLFHVTC